MTKEQKLKYARIPKLERLIIAHYCCDDGKNCIQKYLLKKVETWKTRNTEKPQFGNAELKI